MAETVTYAQQVARCAVQYQRLSTLTVKQSHNQPRCLARTELTSSHPECKVPLAWSPEVLQQCAWKLLIFVCRALTQMKIRLKGAQKGHSLLKKKADALTLKFRQILSKIIEVSLPAKLLLFLGCSFPQWKHDMKLFFPLLIANVLVFLCDVLFARL